MLESPLRSCSRSLLKVEVAVLAVTLLLAAGAVWAAVTVGGKKIKGAERLKATLVDTEVVPGPGDPDLRAKADVFVNPRKGEVCFDIDLQANVPGAKEDDPVIAAFIHPGPAGSACGVGASAVVSLDCPGSVDLDFANEGLEGCVDAGTELLSSIVQQPELFYLDVHTAKFPGGALRGQLEKD